MTKHKVEEALVDQKDQTLSKESLDGLTNQTLSNVSSRENLLARRL